MNSKKQKKKYYKIRFNCNSENDHKASITQLIETNSVTFTDKDKALEFLFECTAPITTLSELVGNKDKSLHNITKRKPFEKPIRF